MNTAREISCVMAVFVLASAPVRAGLVLQYEGALTSTPPLLRPTAVTVDPGATGICVTDAARRTIDIFDAQGFHAFHTDRLAGITGPQDGCLDAQGGLVFTDGAGASERTIRRLDFLGEPLPYSPDPPRAGWCPGHLIVMRDGNYLTIDQRTGLVAKHDAMTGALIWQVEPAADEPERQDLLGRPAEAPDGRIYVPGGSLRRIMVLSADGQLDTSFGHSGAKRGEFAFPIGVAFGPAGTVMVLDRIRHCVLLFDADHKFLGESGGLGEGPGSFYHPTALSASADGRVYVAQGYQGRVQAFRLIDTQLVSRAPSLAVNAAGGGAPKSE